MRVLGIMSGTSLDGVDYALCEVRGGWGRAATCSSPRLITDDCLTDYFPTGAAVLARVMTSARNRLLSGGSPRCSACIKSIAA